MKTFKVYSNGLELIYEDKINLNLFIRESIGTNLIVTIEKFNCKRSQEANAYYWGVVIVDIIEYLKNTQGEVYSKENIHDFHLIKFTNNKLSTISIMNELVISSIGKTTSQMNFKEFNNFLNSVIHYWEGYDCFIHEADKNYK